jgi:uncharacterized membrane protein YdbT with pleckstrin-like domain
MPSTHKKPSEAQLKATPGHTKNPLAAYCYYPHQVAFSHMDDEEIVILLLRRHAVTNVPWIVAAVLMFLAPLLIDLTHLLSFLPSNFQARALLVWYLITLAFAFEKFLVWFFNVNIVTDERIFDVDFHNLLYREITDANLDQVQDVTVRMGSFVRTIFNYGDVIIQTAGEVPRIEFSGVPYPDRVAKVLRDLRVEEEQEKHEGRVR